jgi:hypothetical protein
MVQSMTDVTYAHVDAESNLELVRQLNILSTPTTLFLNRDGVEVGRAMGTPKRSQVLAAVAAVHSERATANLSQVVNGAIALYT